MEMPTEQNPTAAIGQEQRPSVAPVSPSEARRRRLIFRVGSGSLSFSYQAGHNPDIVFQPYVVRSGVSMAANLREALKTCDLLLAVAAEQGAQPWSPLRTYAMVDGDAMMVPVEEFDEGTMAALYASVYPGGSHDALCYDVLPELNAVAVYGVNRDLRLVLNDHYPDVRIMHLMGPVWRHLHQRSFTGRRQKLYAYFHERSMEVFAFRQNRFKFCNKFEATSASDAVYYLLNVWSQLQLQPEQDELHIAGNAPKGDDMTAMLHRFVQNVYVLNAAADLNGHPITTIKDMPYDLMTFYARGR